jgi:hypothetical protein
MGVEKSSIPLENISNPLEKSSRGVRKIFYI